jgi:hypothetical protein
LTLSRTIPALPVVSIADGVRFYVERLGFTASYQDDSFARLVRDDAELHLWAAKDDGWKEREATVDNPVRSGAESFLAGTASCRIRVEGIDELYAEYRAAGVLYDANTTIRTQPWGQRDFPALDLHRNLLTFYEPLEG